MAHVRSAAEVIISPVYRVQSLATYLFKGTPLRRSRFHNHRGERVDAKGLAYLPHSVATTTWLKLTGRRPETPWLGYRAVKRLDELIEPDWRILEFGSGMSTIWFARRCAFVLSLETDDRWFANVRAHLERAGLENVDCRLCSTTADGGRDYSGAVSDLRAGVRPRTGRRRPARPGHGGRARAGEARRLCLPRQHRPSQRRLPDRRRAAAIRQSSLGRSVLSRKT